MPQDRSLSIVGALVIVKLATTLPAIAGFPPGYEFIRITDSPQPDSRPRLNSRGDVVFWTKSADQQSDILRFRDGELSWITDDVEPDGFPRINDNGVIAWSRFTGPDNLYGPTAEIVRSIDGEMDYLTSDDADDYIGNITNDGQIIWMKYNYTGCLQANRVLELFDDGEITALTDGDSSDQSPMLNEGGQYIWTRYNWCGDRWTSQIFFSNGVDRVELADGLISSQLPAINNHGVVTWHHRDPETDERMVVVYENGELRTLANGSSPRINDHGDVIFTRFNQEYQQWQMWVYLRGEIIQLTDNDEYNSQSDINNRTDMVWVSKDHPQWDIVMLKRLPFGDMNCDKSVDFADIDGFVVALVSGKDEFTQRFPDCDWWLADMNDDRSIDFNDLDPFIDCLINGGCERP